MIQLLPNFLEAGLIEGLNGSDERLQKITDATNALANELKASPNKLIRAVLSGLDPDIPSDDPIIIEAKEILADNWKTMASVHPSTPVALLRSQILAACFQVAEGTNGAIVWLTAIDTLPLLKLGAERHILVDALHETFERVEAEALRTDEFEMPKRGSVVKPPVIKELEVVPAKKMPREALLPQIIDAVGPHGQNAQPRSGSNPHWSNAGSSWGWEFAPRMSTLLLNQLDIVLKSTSEDLNGVVAKLNEQNAELVKSVANLMSDQWKAAKEAIEASQKQTKFQEIKLESLWWFESLYSKTLRQSYRTLAPEIASVVMGSDLLSLLPGPTPASVSFVLAEAVGRLPGAAHDVEYTITTILEKIRDGRALLQPLAHGLTAAPTAGRFSVRDAVVSVLHGQNEPDVAIKLAGIQGDVKFTLPSFAQVFFRQQQAVAIAK